MIWFGESHTFTATQAAAVKLLWEAWEASTPELGQRHILDSIGSESHRLSDIFRNPAQRRGKREKGKPYHPAWGTMIDKGTTEGSYRLTPPTKN